MNTTNDTRKFICTAFEHSTRYGLIEYNGISFVYDRQTGYISATDIFKQFKTSSGKQREFSNWEKLYGKNHIAETFTFLTKNAPYSLFNGSIMFICNGKLCNYNESKSMIELTKVTKYISMDVDSTIRKIKGTYIHIRLAMFVLRYLNGCSMRLNVNKIILNYANALNIKCSVLYGLIPTVNIQSKETQLIDKLKSKIERRDNKILALEADNTIKNILDEEININYDTIKYLLSMNKNKSILVSQLAEKIDILLYLIHILRIMNMFFISIILYYNMPYIIDNYYVLKTKYYL